MDTPSVGYITGDPAFAVDKSGTIVHWNDAAEGVLGIKSSEALGQKCWKLLGGRDIYGNRHCYESCPVRAMAFDHEPVHSFNCNFSITTSDSESFNISCVVMKGDDGRELLLHICRPEDGTIATTSHTQLPQPSMDALSEREHEILVMLANKVKTSEIAKNLSISVRTVRTHIQHLMYKLNVHKRADAIKVGKKLGLI